MDVLTFLSLSCAHIAYRIYIHKRGARRRISNAFERSAGYNWRPTIPSPPFPYTNRVQGRPWTMFRAVVNFVRYPVQSSDPVRKIDIGNSGCMSIPPPASIFNTFKRCIVKSTPISDPTSRFLFSYHLAIDNRIDRRICIRQRLNRSAQYHAK